MKLRKLIALALVAVMVVGFAAVGVSADDTITLTVWGAEEDQTLLAELVEGFKAAYPDYTFDIQVGVESEGTAKDTVLTDVEAAADVFAFADDQINELVAAGALVNLDEYSEVLSMAGKTIDDIKSANVAVSIEAATVDGSLYAFPKTADNGYFLYYDASLISAEDAQSWDTLLAAAEAAGKKVAMTLNSGWYNASFFYGAGFTTGLNEDGTTYIDWNGTSELGYTGVDVVKAMLNIAGNSAFMATSDLSNQIASGNVCAVISGTWDASAVEAAFAEPAATKLPTYTLGDEQIQMGSVAGCKLVGVNGLSENSGWAILLADYITNEEAQTKCFEERQLGPSNVNAAASDEVQANFAQAGLAEQAPYSKIQRVGGKYWDPTATFGEMIAQGTLSVDDDAAIQEALDTMVEGVTAAVE